NRQQAVAARQTVLLAALPPEIMLLQQEVAGGYIPFAQQCQKQAGMMPVDNGRADKTPERAPALALAHGNGPLMSQQARQTKLKPFQIMLFYDLPQSRIIVGPAHTTTILERQQ